MLRQELQFYIDHQKELVEKYLKKFIVIKNNAVVDVYDSEIQAYTESVKKYELGSFLIQECMPGEENYTQTFRTRVIFDR